MIVKFANNKLERCYQRESLSVREWGQVVGKRYGNRIAVIEEANNFEELYEFNAWHLHPLHEDREGQWAIWLNERVRLIVGRPDEDTVEIIEVQRQHYGH